MAAGLSSSLKKKGGLCPPSKTLKKGPLFVLDKEAENACDGIEKIGSDGSENQSSDMETILMRNIVFNILASFDSDNKGDDIEDNEKRCQSDSPAPENGWIRQVGIMGRHECLYLVGRGDGNSYESA